MIPLTLDPLLHARPASIALNSCTDRDQLCTAVLEATGNQWLASAANWLIAKPLAIALIVLLGLFLRWLANRLVDRVVERTANGVFRDSSGIARERRRQRAVTMGSVLKSIAAFAIFTVVTIMAIGELGYPVGPLIASAGIVGVALGFGAQSLVKDFLAGMFMLFEDQLGVGDEVVLGDTKGVVEALTLRVTRLRGEDGTIWYVRNGEILKVGNQSQGAAAPVVEEPER